MKLKYKYEYLKFEETNDSIESIFKNIYDIFIPIERQVELYERNLINCTTLGELYQMKLPKIEDIESSTFGNLLMEITDDSDFKKETKEQFKLLFNQDLCNQIAMGEKSIKFCTNFWDGILKEGLEQAIIHLGVFIGQSLDELNSLNDVNNNKTLLNLIGDSSFFQYQLFTEFYLNRAYQQIDSIFTQLRTEKLNSIQKIMKQILIVYLIISIFLFILLFYFIYTYENEFNSFLNFIAIIPHKYLSEDDNLYKNILKFGNKYYL